VSLLALGHGTGVRVVAVESTPACCQQFRESLAANGWEDRAQLCQAFIGGKTSFQEMQLASGEAAGTPFLSQDEFIARYGLTHIDFLKCDIEGSEFDLLKPGSRLLAMTDRLAVR
jgi:FkbM family methyltransferase